MCSRRPIRPRGPQLNEMEVRSTASVQIKENGDREETYTWQIRMACQLNSLQIDFPLPKPEFTSGAFSLPVWINRFQSFYEVTGEVDGRFRLIIPPPPPTFPPGDPTAHRYAWRVIDRPQLRAPRRHDMIGHLLTRLTEGYVDPEPPNWREGQPLVTFHPIEKPYGGERVKQVDVSMRIEGICLSGRMTNYGLLGTQLEASIPPVFNCPDLSDFDIHSDEGETFHCHKIILSVGSDYFKTMFAADTRERKEGWARLEGLDGKALKLALQWMYGIDVKDKISTPQDRMELYRVAHQLCIVKFPMEALLEDILKSVTVDSAFDAYIFGETYQKDAIMAKAVQVIQREKGEFAGVDFLNECVKRCPSLLRRLKI